MSEQPSETYRLQVESHARFVYFLLGVAAAAIAFALHETRGQALALVHAPAGVAVACWAASFATGMAGMARRQNVLRGQSELLRLQQGIVPPPVPGVPTEVAAAALQEMIEARARAVARCWNWQQWLLFAGAIAYVAGQVAGMAMPAGIQM